MRIRAFLLQLALVPVLGCGDAETVRPKPTRITDAQPSRRITEPIIGLANQRTDYSPGEEIEYSVLVDYRDGDRLPTMVEMQIRNKNNKIVFDSHCPASIGPEGGKHLYEGKLKAPVKQGQYKIHVIATYDCAGPPVDGDGAKSARVGNVTSKLIAIAVK